MTNSEVLKREQKWSWDGARDRETLIVRRMERDDPKEVLKDYGRERLKEIFLKNLHRFDRINANFWKLILKVSDEEIDRAAKESPRFGIKIWDK